AAPLRTSPGRTPPPGRAAARGRSAPSGRPPPSRCSVKKSGGGGNLGTAEPRHFHDFKVGFAVFTAGSQVPTFSQGLRLAARSGGRSAVRDARDNRRLALARPPPCPNGRCLRVPPEKSGNLGTMPRNGLRRLV